MTLEIKIRRLKIINNGIYLLGMDLPLVFIALNLKIEKQGEFWVYALAKVMDVQSTKDERLDFEV